MKRFILAVAISAVGVSVTACGAAGSSGTETEAVPLSRAVEESSSQAIENSDNQEPSVWDTWSMPELGTYEPPLSAEEIFRPCRDIPDEVADELGIEILRNSEDPGAGYQCRFLVDDYQGEAGSFFFTATEDPVELLVETGLSEVESRIEQIPGGLVTRYPGFFEEESCEATVDTVRGTVSIVYANLLLEPSGETYCEIPSQILVSLFKRGEV
ncbi:DUF3558 family protein [Corynebacterium phocae]|uniref:DUF3558 family protein n=1 Tax=Corynebacterium phocae TaxID=161895 RepID=UPI00147151FF|nr:DUF3558 family protein [Corynebacterium phocae]